MQVAKNFGWPNSSAKSSAILYSEKKCPPTYNSFGQRHQTSRVGDLGQSVKDADINDWHAASNPVIVSVGASVQMPKEWGHQVQSADTHPADSIRTPNQPIKTPGQAIKTHSQPIKTPNQSIKTVSQLFKMPNQQHKEKQKHISNKWDVYLDDDDDDENESLIEPNPYVRSVEITSSCVAEDKKSHHSTNTAISPVSTNTLAFYVSDQTK